MTDEIDQIKKAIAALEAQRQLLGDAVVDTALSPLREKLTSLQLQPGVEQRKMVTVLFADLVGFTQMSEKMDPEDIREIVNSYFTRWSANIEKYGGVVEKFIGDAVMAVFGLNVAREDDAENAIRTALDMRQSLSNLNDELELTRGIHLAMRTGIHTGLAMISILGDRQARKAGQDFVAVGDTVNLASRLQSIAPEGGIVISHDTFRLVRGIFDIQEQGPIQVKGKKEPVRAYLVLQAKQRTFHSPARGVEGIETRMIGREAELQLMKDTMSVTMEQRRTQVIVITGEAGIGKSRLLSEFENWLEMTPKVVRYYKCRVSPGMENLPYSLFRDMISFRFQIQDNDSPQLVQEKIVKGMEEFSHPDNQRRAIFIGHLLGFRLPGSTVLTGASQDPLMFLDTTLAYLTDYFKEVAKNHTVALVLEDIHWADESSLGLLDRLIARLPDQQLLLVCTARPSLYERHPKWGENGSWGESAPMRIDLKPLNQADIKGLIEEILQNVDLIPESLYSLIINRTEGNPFFMEEFIKMLIEDGIILKEDDQWRIDLTRLANVAIPATLVEVLQARFDSLSLEERVLLQRASVIGKTFWDDAVSSMEASLEDQVQLITTIESILRALTSREMIFHMRDSAFESTNEFIFKHALLRDVIYESVLKRLRKIYHANTAAWLVSITQGSGRSDEYAVLIAEHYDRAEEPVKARHYYMNAGSRAAERYANAEGIRCYSRCLELTPEDDLTDRYDLLLRRVKLYDTIAARQSQKSDLETLQMIAEQIDLNTSPENALQERSNKSYRSEVYLQWWHYYDALSDFQSSIATARQSIALSQAAGDTESEARGYLYLGATSWRRSDYSAAETDIKKSLSLARKAHSRNLEGDALRNLGIVRQYQRDYKEAQEHYEAARLIYHETGAEKGESMVLNSLGVLLTDQDRLHEARSYFERSLDLKRKIANRRAINTTLHNLGILTTKMGRYSEASKIFTEVLTYSVEVGDIEAQAEAYGALGSVAIHLGSFQDAREHLEQAILTYRKFDSQEGICVIKIAQAMLAAHIGDFPSALSLSQEALVLAQELDLDYEQASAVTYAGYVLLSMDRAEEASERLQEALELWQELGKSNMLKGVIETKAALARACLAMEKREKAFELVEEVMTSLVGQAVVTAKDTQDLSFSALEGMEAPFKALLNAYIVLDTVGDLRAGLLLDKTYQLLHEQASWVDEDGLRASFLENISAHREITTLWKWKRTPLPRCRGRSV